MRESVFIIITDAEHNVLLQHRDASAPRNPNTWSLWSGMIEVGETPVTAARRELKEELDIEVPADHLKPFRTYGSLDRIRHVFYVLDNGSDDAYDLKEGDAFKRVPQHEIAHMEVNEISQRILTDFFDEKRTPRSS